MKRIVFLSNAYSIQGGGERSLIDLIDKIKDRYKIFCVCRKEGELAKDLQELGVGVFFCDVSWSHKTKRQFFNYLRLFKVYQILKKNKPNLIYANSGDINPFAVRLSKLLNTPVITHVQDVFDVPKKDKYLFSKSNAIIACSNIVKEKIRYFKDNVNVVYGGVDKNKFRPYPDKKKQKFGSSFLVGNIGTIEEKKGFLEFIEVANRVIGNLDIKFLIIGSAKPEEEDFLIKLKEKIKQYNLENRIVFTGFVKEIEKVLPLLDILLFPTRKEAFGRVVIEAFACGVPVISTYSGGPEEIIENGKDGFLFKIGDIQGMSDMVIKLYEDKMLYNYIQENCYKKFLEKFTIEKMVEKITSIIDNLLNS